MKTMSDGPAYSCKEFPKVSYIDSLSVWNKEENELDFFLQLIVMNLVNR